MGCAGSPQNESAGTCSFPQPWRRLHEFQSCVSGLCCSGAMLPRSPLTQDTLCVLPAVASWMPQGLSPGGVGDCASLRLETLQNLGFHFGVAPN